MDTNRDEMKMATDIDQKTTTMHSNEFTVYFQSQFPKELFQ